MSHTILNVNVSLQPQHSEVRLAWKKAKVTPTAKQPHRTRDKSRCYLQWASYLMQSKARVCCLTYDLPPEHRAKTVQVGLCLQPFCDLYVHAYTCDTRYGEKKVKPRLLLTHLVKHWARYLANKDAILAEWKSGSSTLTNECFASSQFSALENALLDWFRETRSTFPQLMITFAQLQEQSSNLADHSGWTYPLEHRFHHTLQGVARNHVCCVHANERVPTP